MSTASIEHEDHSDICRSIRLSGRLDMIGTGEITMKFASLSAAKGRRLIVDLRAVTFLASVAIRDIINNAKAVSQRGGRLVLLVGDNDLVAKTLETTGVNTIVPMFATEREALEAAVA